MAVPWNLPDPFDGLTIDHLYRVQCKIDEGEYRASDQSPEWAGYAVGEVLGLDPVVKKDRQRIKQVLKEWTANGMFKEVTGKDKKGNDRPFVRVATWVNDLSSSPEKGEVRNGGEARNNHSSPPPPSLWGGCGEGVKREPEEVGGKKVCAVCENAGCEWCS